MENKNRKSVKRVFVLVGAIAAMLAMAASPAVATTSDPKTRFIAWMPLAHIGYDGFRTYTHLPASIATPDPTATSNLDPVDIAACNLGLQDSIVALLPSKEDGLVRLTCGNRDVGYVHIRQRHQRDWENRMPEPGIWDDFMLWSTTNVLRLPETVKLDRGLKRCYSATEKVIKYVGNLRVLWKVFKPIAIVSSNNKLVVTAFPSTDKTC